MLPRSQLSDCVLSNVVLLHGRSLIYFDSVSFARVTNNPLPQGQRILTRIAASQQSSINLYILYLTETSASTSETHYILCLPILPFGNNEIEITQPRVIPPAR